MTKQKLYTYYKSYVLVITFLFLSAMISSVYVFDSPTNAAIIGAIMGFVHCVSWIIVQLVARNLPDDKKDFPDELLK